MCRQRGFTLLETLVAMGILGFVGVAFMTALFTGFTTTDMNDKLVTAENLVRAQLEYSRGQDYFVPPTVPYLIPPGNDPSAYTVPPPSVTLPFGYDVTVEVAQYCDDSGCYLVDEMQQITARAFHDGKLVSRVSDLKTNR